jgi:hypothetical protein
MWAAVPPLGGMGPMSSNEVRIYAGKRVLLTGHTGFKGGWLATWLTQLGADVTGYSLPPATSPNLFQAARIASRVRSVEGDIRDRDHLARVWREARPDVVFHLAAQPIVRESYRAPLETIQTNVIGTSNMLETARETAKPVTLLLVTSDKCYENKEWLFGYRRPTASAAAISTAPAKQQRRSWRVAIAEASFPRDARDPRHRGRDGACRQRDRRRRLVARSHRPRLDPRADERRTDYRSTPARHAALAARARAAQRLSPRARACCRTAAIAPRRATAGTSVPIRPRRERSRMSSNT